MCEDQNRALSRLIGNRFITFLRVVVSGVGKEEFLKMLKEDRLEIGEN